MSHVAGLLELAHFKEDNSSGGLQLQHWNGISS